MRQTEHGAEALLTPARLKYGMVYFLLQPLMLRNTLHNPKFSA